MEIVYIMVNILQKKIADQDLHSFQNLICLSLTKQGLRWVGLHFRFDTIFYILYILPLWKVSYVNLLQMKIQFSS